MLWIVPSGRAALNAGCDLVVCIAYAVGSLTLRSGLG